MSLAELKEPGTMEFREPGRQASSCIIEENGYCKPGVDASGSTGQILGISKNPF